MRRVTQQPDARRIPISDRIEFVRDGVQIYVGLIGGDNTRHCKKCKSDHGVLYLCPKYPKIIKTRIKEDQAAYQKWLLSESARNAMGSTEHSIMLAFAGQKASS